MRQSNKINSALRISQEHRKAGYWRHDRVQLSYLNCRELCDPIKVLDENVTTDWRSFLAVKGYVCVLLCVAKWLFTNAPLSYLQVPQRPPTISVRNEYGVTKQFGTNFTYM